MARTIPALARLARRALASEDAIEAHVFDVVSAAADDADEDIIDSNEPDPDRAHDARRNGDLL